MTSGALYYLVGPPAVGKLTVARLVAARLDGVVVDNHLWNDAVLVPGGVSKGADIRPLDDLREQVRQITLQAAALAPASLVQVFTHYLDDDPFCVDVVEQMRDLARRRAVPFVPVWLQASDDVLLRRVRSEDRAGRAKISSVEVLRQVLAVPRLAPPPDALVIDTDHLSPAETAERVLRRASELGVGLGAAPTVES